MRFHRPVQTLRAVLLAATPLTMLPLACAHPGVLPAPPSGVRTVVVAAPQDRTGTVLGGERYLERLLCEPRTTLAEVLAAELRRALSHRGFTVLAAVEASSGAGAIDAVTLALDVQRWEPDVPELRFVRVSFDARLLDEDGTVLWSAGRTGWQVPTRGAPTPEAAATMAARAVAEGLVEGWPPRG